MPKKDKRSKSPLWARMALVMGIILVVASGSTFAAAQAAINKVNNAIPDQDLLGDVKGGDAKQHADIKGAKNILLASLDTRPSWSTDGTPSRTDSIIILHISADKSHAYMLSVPRDTLLKIPACQVSANGCAQPYAGGKNKINSAFMYGSRGLDGDKAIASGTKLLAKALQQDLGITPDAAAIIDYSGFRSIIQTMGGVCMYVDEDVISIHRGKTADGKFAVPFTTDSGGGNARPVKGVTPNTYKVGNHCFDANDALDYARQRDKLSKGDSDYGRQRHQQQLIKAIVKKAMSTGLNSPTKLPGLVDAIGKAMNVDHGGISLQDWAFAMKDINPDNVITLRTNGDTAKGFCTVPKSEIPSGVGDSQCLTDESMAMFKAAKDDTLEAFVASHPTWVASSS